MRIFTYEKNYEQNSSKFVYILASIIINISIWRFFFSKKFQKFTKDEKIVKVINILAEQCRSNFNLTIFWPKSKIHERRKNIRQKLFTFQLSNTDLISIWRFFIGISKIHGRRKKSSEFVYNLACKSHFNLTNVCFSKTCWDIK